jgi:ubiquinone/menaquinone biosynthesis C-methylase UbiE
VNHLPDDALVADVRDAYAAAADGWATGPAVIYRRLATALVATTPMSLAGRRVLDLGSGTGVASAVLTAAGAAPIGLDLAVEMLTHGEEARPPGVAGDAQQLPFRDRAFGAVVAAFSLNHVPDLGRSLAECRRVLDDGGVLLASTFPSGHDHPAKAIVEDVLERHGYRRPNWYATFKARIADLTGNADAFAAAATEAGFTAVRTDTVEVQVGLDRPDIAAEWRLNMPHTLGFVDSLDPVARADLRAAATAALRGPLPSAVTMLALRASRTGRSRQGSAGT